MDRVRRWQRNGYLFGGDGPGLSEGIDKDARLFTQPRDCARTFIISGVAVRSSLRVPGWFYDRVAGAAVHLSRYSPERRCLIADPSAAQTDRVGGQAA
jgi:hypothetical protein